ncbi:adenylate/guanylate cyclase domain-containing protein [Legionella spiritensis]|uniref:Guanylate cyclase domain-containing protein n=1 Tax=Legionella spiritensis TaxID=452 RepID=A0A0W0Z5E8_LEGSP|nr:adenylate/guanylate cyclase domain-containing protein [Legionella spiritensis]KTD64063.1 hypothetical protein Lspi_1582 [Legionella spiritensis]SNV37517.1 Uncharacterised protein [Legionella spiritensis]
MRALFSLILIVLRLSHFLLWVLILLCLFGMIKPYIKNISSYTYLQPIVKVENTINIAVKKTIPTTIADKDASRIITIAVLLFISIYISHLIAGPLQKFKARIKLREYRKKAVTAPQKILISQIEEQLDSSVNFKAKNRQELLKDFVRLKKELEKSGRTLSFLSIDVVDSTGMKQDEDPVIVENDFNQYHDYINQKFKEHGYIKAAWTPDGVMACFNTTEQAISAAKDIILGLVHFNKSVKMMQNDFHVRCGINTGFVYYDLSTPLEEFSDRVIDIAGHMQKHAPVDSVLVAKEIIKPIKSSDVFRKSDSMVDGLEVFEWRSSRK